MKTGKSAALQAIVMLALCVFAAALAIGRSESHAQSPSAVPAGCLARQPDCQPPLSRNATPVLLVEARPGQPWITGEHIAAALPVERPSLLRAGAVLTDTTPPSPPISITVGSDGLFMLTGTWGEAADLESGIARYEFAIGTGVLITNESNVRHWQVAGANRSFVVNQLFTEGVPVHVAVRAYNGAGLYSSHAHSAAITPTRRAYGEAGNVLSYTLAETGIDAAGNVTATWTVTGQTELRGFLDRMLPVLHDLYGPPAISYTVKLVRDLRYTSSAIFFPTADEIHGGDTMTLQLLTHELVHAFRNDRIVSSNPIWQYDTTYSSFEEGFAHAVAYEAMTEFARRHPDYPLSQRIYGSSTDWDYDFQNVPELRTTDFWSNFGGTNLHWIRYEMAAAAFLKADIAHPGFFRNFNAAYYARINATPTLTISRGLLVDLVREVAPDIEGLPAADWVAQQHVLATGFAPGEKVWRYTQRYPSRPFEFLTFNTLHAYQTFPNGSDWAWLPDGLTYQYHHLNGITGTSTISMAVLAAPITRTHLLSPTRNPNPADASTLAFGYDALTLMSQTSVEPWPGGAPDDVVTGLTGFGLYEIQTRFYTGTRVLSSTVHDVQGLPLSNTAGVWGGIVGAHTGTVSLRHRSGGVSVTVPLVNGAFHALVDWASVVNTPTNSIDTVRGAVDVVYEDGAGLRCPAVRVVSYGSWYGNQAFLFALRDGRLQPAYVDAAAGSLACTMNGATVTPTPAPTSTPTPAPTATPMLRRYTLPLVSR